MTDAFRTFVKICGITRVPDALAAARAGADAIGFIFAPSPRRVTRAKAAAIAGEVHPSIRRIGVFVNSGTGAILKAVKEVGLDGVQLHGLVDQATVDELRKHHPPLLIFKVVRTASPEAVAAALALGVDAVFVDPKDTDHPMAHVDSFPIELLKQLGPVKMIVAGGLTPDNVGAVVTEVRPWGVDVSGGVESAPGLKDPAKISSFVQAVRAAEAAR